MKKIFFLGIVLLISTPVLSQVLGQQGRGVNRIQNRVPQQPPNESQKEEMARKVEQKKQQFITDFVNKLEADEFQKEITKQTINDYFDKKIELLKVPFGSFAEREDALRLFNKNHFAELKTLLSKNDMKKIMDMAEGKINDEEEEDKKKKKRKKRKRNKDKKDGSNDDDN